MSTSREIDNLRNETMAGINNRTNYGKFNIRFHGVKVWNSIPDKLKEKPLSTFKRHLTESLLDKYLTQK